jgi:transcriptional regulator with XRE-family HTH domain
VTGRALRSVRLALNLTLHELSERISIPAADLDAYERGEKLMESGRLSAALERLAPEVEKLDTIDPLLAIPPLRALSARK